MKRTIRFNDNNNGKKEEEEKFLMINNVFINNHLLNAVKSFNGIISFLFSSSSSSLSSSSLSLSFIIDYNQINLFCACADSLIHHSMGVFIIKLNQLLEKKYKLNKLLNDPIDSYL